MAPVAAVLRTAHSMARWPRLFSDRAASCYFAMSRGKRRYPIGAEPIGPDQTHFRVWAPKAQHVDLVLEENAARHSRRIFHALEAEKGGYFSGSANAGAGACYRFRVNDRS